MHSDYSHSPTQQPIWYYLIFPVDAWVQQPDLAFQEQKATEIWPVMIWLMPLIVLLAGMVLSLGFWSGIFFYGFEALLLTGVCKFYAGLDDLGQLIELSVNFWLSFVILTLAAFLLFGLLSIFV